MKRYNASVKVVMRFEFEVQAPDENAAEVRADTLLGGWLQRKHLSGYEILNERDISVEEQED